MKELCYVKAVRFNKNCKHVQTRLVLLSEELVSLFSSGQPTMRSCINWGPNWSSASSCELPGWQPNVRV